MFPLGCTILSQYCLISYSEGIFLIHKYTCIYWWGGGGGYTVGTFGSAALFFFFKQKSILVVVNTMDMVIRCIEFSGISKRMGKSKTVGFFLNLVIFICMFLFNNWVIIMCEYFRLGDCWLVRLSSVFSYCVSPWCNVCNGLGIAYQVININKQGELFQTWMVVICVPYSHFCCCFDCLNHFTVRKDEKWELQFWMHVDCAIMFRSWSSLLSVYII